MKEHPRHFRVLGWNVLSDLPLTPLEGQPESETDWEWVRSQAESLPNLVDFSELWAEVRHDPFIQYQFGKRSDGKFAGWFPDRALFSWDPTSKVIESTFSRQCGEYLQSILFSWNVLSFIRLSQGRLVFHASAIQRGGDCWLISGLSGSGKSTLAALANQNGFSVMADDACMLTWMESGNFWQVEPATNELRLRKNAAEVLNTITSGLEETEDSRWKLRAPQDLRPARLKGICLPQIRREHHGPIWRDIPPSEALFRLHSCLRIVNWKPQSVLIQHFREISKLVASISVMEWNLIENEWIKREVFRSFLDLDWNHASILE